MKNLKEELMPHLISIAKFMNDEKGLKIRPYPKVRFVKDEDNAKEIFGRTAFYTPEDKTVTLYTEGRHPKDILRSYAHELIHHHQNLKGDMSKESVDKLKDDPAYATNDKHLRLMEAQAYLWGNMVFRDHEDAMKNKK